MKKISTNFLRFMISLIGLGVLALCIFALPSLWQDGSVEYPEASNAFLLIMIGMYATTIPFYFALWQTFKLLNYIDRNQAFSASAIKALRNIKYSALVISVIYVAGIPLLLPIAEADDAPGLMVFGPAFACAPVAVTAFSAVLQRLLETAIEIKSENDLTV